MTLSVIIPIYNGAGVIGGAVRSLELLNSGTDFEIILVNDNSSDDSLTVCHSLAEEFENVRVISNNTNLGVAGARQRGIEASRGEYITFCDQDDEVVAPYSTYLEMISGQGADLLVTNYYITFRNDRKLSAEIPETIFYGDRSKTIPGENNNPSKKVLEGSIILKKTEQTALDIPSQTIHEESNILSDTGQGRTDITAIDKSPEDGAKKCREFAAGLLLKGFKEHGKPILANTIWNCIFKKSVVIENGLEIKGYLSFEDDWLFMIDFLSHACSVILCTRPYYNWIIREKSQSHVESYKEGYYEKNLRLDNKVEAAADLLDIPDSTRKKFKAHIKVRRLIGTAKNAAHLPYHGFKDEISSGSIGKDAVLTGCTTFKELLFCCLFSMKMWRPLYRLFN